MRVVVLSTTVEDQTVVTGVFGPYADEEAASRAVGILRDPEKLKRLPRGEQIFTTQRLLEDPSAFVEAVERLLAPREE
jgi:hypothetical protein